MNGDFSRIRFEDAQTYSRVLVNQGRMLLDAEVNAQSAIHHAFLRSFIVDLVGPVWRAGKNAFALAPLPAAGPVTDFSIGEGNMYVQGIPCRNVARDCRYGNQPFGPLPADESNVGFANGVFIYIEVRERHVGPEQEPSLREAALGGAASATRAQIVWQVHALGKASALARLDNALKALARRPPQPGDDASDVVKDAKDVVNDSKFTTETDRKDAFKAFGKFLDAIALARPMMAAKALADPRAEGPCALSPDAAYRGCENQLYRFEVHQSGLAKATGDGGVHATFKWSRENGSVMFRVVPGSVTVTGRTMALSVESPGRDRRTALCEGQWVEIACNEFELSEAAHPLGRVTQVDRARCAVTVEFGASAPPIDQANMHGVVLRRWDHNPDGDESGTIPIVEGDDADEWLAVERGLGVRFARGGRYRTGDYWLVPARITTGIEWPRDGSGTPVLELPHGPQRVTAGLGAGSGNELKALAPSLEPLAPLTA